MEIIFIRSFRPRENPAGATLTIDYKTSIPLLVRLAKAVIAKMKDQEGDLIMANPQARFISVA